MGPEHGIGPLAGWLLSKKLLAFSSRRILSYTVRYRYNAANFLTNSHKKLFGVSFVDSASDWYSAKVAVIIYVMSYNNGQRYNGTRL